MLDDSLEDIRLTSINVGELHRPLSERAHVERPGSTAHVVVLTSHTVVASPKVLKPIAQHAKCLASPSMCGLSGSNCPWEPPLVRLLRRQDADVPHGVVGFIVLAILISRSAST